MDASTPLLLTFKEREPPIFIEIPGEQAKTKIYEHYEILISCKKCLRCGHTKKECHEAIAMCARCSCQGPDTDKCTSTEVRCFHCGDDHQVFSRSCLIFKREIEIVQIQTKERIPRLQAIRKLLRLNPNSEL